MIENVEKSKCLFHPDVEGGREGSVKGLSCPRCKGTRGHCSPDEGLFSWFCGNTECLLIDSQAMKKSKPFKSDKDKTPCTSIERFNLGKRFTRASLSDLRAPEAIQCKILNWIKNPSDFLVYAGSPGVGKTYLCAALIGYFSGKGKEVYYTNNRRFFEHIQGAMSKNVGNYESIKIFKEKELLIFDDLGASRNTEWQAEMILDLIDHRYENRLPTIITTNYSSHDIKEIFSERTMRRIFNQDNTIINQFREN